MTEAQKKVYGYIVSFIQRKGYAPTFREIGKGVGITPSVVNLHLSSLRAAGIVDWNIGKSRTIKILKQETLNPGDTYRANVNVIKVKQGIPTVIRVNGQNYMLQHIDTNPLKKSR